MRIAVTNKCEITMKIYDKDFYVSIPVEDGQIEDVIKSMFLLLEMAGWHRLTIEEWILDKSQEIIKIDAAKEHLSTMDFDDD
jgi:hypothetical protein